MADHKHYLYILLLILMIVSIPACAKPRGGQASREFDAARLLVTQGKYAEAIPKLQTFQQQHPNHADASRAQFFIAKAYLGMDDLVSARSAFESVIQTYPGSLEAHKSEYKLALIDLWEGRSDEAVARFRSLAEHPNGPLAPEAKAMLHYLESTSDGGE